MNILHGKSILITGGAGTLGKAIIARAHRENWGSKITIFSTDPTKHLIVKKRYPDVNCVVGDIRDETTVFNAMAGKEIVIHAAAVKEIPASEYNSIDAYQINVQGSLNVANAAIMHGVEHVLGISTDKACSPANAYGATKMLMEKNFQEFAIRGFPTQFHLVRYGNVLESSASVLEHWAKAAERGEPLTITDPNMTRFWLSPNQAVDYVIESMEVPFGRIFVPRMPALSIGKLAEYMTTEGYPVKVIGLRPGEKMHETLVTVEEMKRAYHFLEFFVVEPSVGEYHDPETTKYEHGHFSSDLADELTKEKLMELLKNE
jgi:UDP-N-acetylglucosamine 4,6-dehydratase/5-epimerase